MSDKTNSALVGSFGKASETAAQSSSKLLTNLGLERLDMSDAIREKSLSIHPLGSFSVHSGEAVGHVRVFDLEHVYAHQTAKAAIKNAYITPLFLIEAFAQNYRRYLLRKLTRGNDKGLLVLDPKVSTYVHRLSDSSELVVKSETVEVEGIFTRRLTITCREQITEGGVQ